MPPRRSGRHAHPPASPAIHAAVIASGVFDPSCKNMAIAVDRRGRVYVADTVRLEIIAFEEGAPS